MNFEHIGSEGIGAERIGAERIGVDWIGLFKKEHMETTLKHPIWKQALEDFHASDLKTSGIVTRKWLLSAFRMTEPTDDVEEFKKFSWDFYANFDQFRRTLLEKHNIDLKNIWGSGDYAIIPPQKQTQAALDDMEKDLKKTLRQTLKRCIHVDANALNQAQRQENLEAINKVVGIKHICKTRLEISVTANILE